MFKFAAFFFLRELSRVFLELAASEKPNRLWRELAFCEPAAGVELVLGTLEIFSELSFDL